MTVESLDELKAQLELQDKKLQSLLEITNNLHHDFSLENVSKTLDFTLREQLGYVKFLLIYKDENWQVLVKNGVRIRYEMSDVLQDCERFQKPTFISDSANEWLQDFQLVVPVFHEAEAIAYLFVNKNKSNDKILAAEDYEEDIRFLHTIVNVVVMAILNRKMMRMELSEQALKKEIRLASTLQNMLFPTELPSNTKMDISAKFIQRHKVGGDYYDFIPLENEKYMLCIGDVSGKGISAAMLMSNFQATLRTIFKYEHFELDFLVQELNKTVINTSGGEKFITFFIAIFDAKTRKLTYVNAGHNHPILTDGIKYHFLKDGTIGLGMLDELPFIKIGEEDVPPNTTLVMYTDGVVELTNPRGEYFEINRLVNLVHAFYPLKMEDINNIIFSKLNEWREQKDLTDDTAVFSCRFF